MTANEDTMRVLYQALESGDFDAIRQRLADDVVIHLTGGLPGDTGDLRGADAVVEFLQERWPAGSGQTLAVSDVRTQDGDVIVGNQATSAELDPAAAPQCEDRYVLTGDGTVMEGWVNLGPTGM